MTGLPFDDSYEDDATETDDPNKSFADLRKAYNRSEKDRKAYEKEVTELREFRDKIVTEQREVSLDSIFKDVGLNPKHKTLFSKLNPEAEITPEAVKNFASEYELPTVMGEAIEGVTPAATGFNPIQAGGSGDLKIYSREEFDELIYTNPTLAGKLMEEGRVNLQRAKKE